MRSDLKLYLDDVHNATHYPPAPAQESTSLISFRFAQEPRVENADSRGGGEGRGVSVGV